MAGKGELREGEVLLPFDPGERIEAGVTFIGRIRTPYGPGHCPRNISVAREDPPEAWIEMADGYQLALTGLEPGQAVILVYWMAEARRDIAFQNPNHTKGPRGTFALRSPARPNPLAISTVRITSLDRDRGVIGIDAIDCYDGTALVDIKPWVERIDLPLGAR